MEDIQTEDQEMRLSIHSVIHYHTCTSSFVCFLYSLLTTGLVKLVIGYIVYMFVVMKSTTTQYMSSSLSPD